MAFLLPCILYHISTLTSSPLQPRTSLFHHLPHWNCQSQSRSSINHSISSIAHRSRMGFSDFFSGGPYDSRHYEYESSGSRMRRIDYGRMEHDIGYAPPPRSHSRRHSHTHRSNPRAAAADQARHAYDMLSRTTITRKPSLAQRLMRSSSHYEPESPVVRSRSHRSRKPSTMNPTNYYGYGDCVGRGNPYASGTTTRDRDRCSSPQRRRSSARADRAWEAEQREREEAMRAAYNARKQRPSMAASSWTYDWGFDLSGEAGRKASWASARRGRSHW